MTEKQKRLEHYKQLAAKSRIAFDNGEYDLSLAYLEKVRFEDISIKGALMFTRLKIDIERIRGKQ